MNEETINMCAEPNYEAIISEYEKQIIEKGKEIERLNKECDTYMKIATKRGNIINELEKWLEYQADHTMQQHNYYGVLDKLKELKENNKDE